MLGKQAKFAEVLTGPVLLVSCQVFVHPGTIPDKNEERCQHCPIGWFAVSLPARILPGSTTKRRPSFPRVSLHRQALAMDGVDEPYRNLSEGPQPLATDTVLSMQDWAKLSFSVGTASRTPQPLRSPSAPASGGTASGA